MTTITSLQIGQKKIEIDNNYYRFPTNTAVLYFSELGDYTIDLKDYLPEGKTVMLDYNVHVWGESNNAGNLFIGSDIAKGLENGQYILTVYGSGINECLEGSIPVGSERYLTVRVDSYKFSGQIVIRGYRIINNVVNVQLED